jgi:hypothetical protein
MLALLLAASFIAPSVLRGQESEKKDDTKADKPAGAPKPASLLDILKLKKAEKEAEKKEAAPEAKEGEKKDEEKKDEPAKAPAEGDKKDEKKDAKPAVEVKLDELKLPAGIDAETKKKLKDALSKIEIKEGGAKIVLAAPESKDAEAPAATEAPKEGEAQPAAEAETKPKEPQPPMFYMRDGTRLAGYPDVLEVNVLTAYGKLLIPISEVQRIRLSTVQRKEVGDRLQKLIEQLGSEEFDLREEAMEEIRKLGAPASEALRAALESTDEEVKSRAEKLLGEIGEEEEDDGEEDVHLVPLKGEEDEVVTGQFVVMGKVEEASFAVKTRYGRLEFKREDILSVVFIEPLVNRKKFEVPGNTLAGRNQWVDTKVELKKGQSFVVVAKGMITLENFGDVTCGPEGTTNAPSVMNNFPAGALVAKVGDSGTPFVAGPKLEGTAKEDGTLRLGIALRSGSASGSFEVSVEKKEG